MRAAGLWQMAQSSLMAGLLLALFAPSAGAVLVYQRPSTRAIVAARNDGSHAQVIAHGSSPVVSPDGRKVAFVVPHGSDDHHLRLVSIHGGPSRRLTADVFVVDRSAPFVWSPNSRYVAVCSVSNGVFIIDVPHHKRRFVFLGEQCGLASFAPDSSGVLVEGINESSVDLNFVPVTRGETRDCHGSNPAWGKRGFAFNADSGDLLLRKRVGAPARLLHRASSGYAYGRAWSADGNTLLALGGTPTDGLQALLIARKSARTTTFPQRFSALESISRNGQVVLGQQGGNVVAARANGSTRILATAATSPSWTR